MKQKVYLSGGLKSGWQQEVKNMVGCAVEFFDPATHEINDAVGYAAWDLHYVRQCDIVFAYMESTNPSGIGLSLEIGFAHALGKTIIFVDEKSAHDEAFSIRLEIVRESASVVFDNLAEGVAHLLKYG